MINTYLMTKAVESMWQTDWHLTLGYHWTSVLWGHFSSDAGVDSSSVDFADLNPNSLRASDWSRTSSWVIQSYVNTGWHAVSDDAAWIRLSSPQSLTVWCVNSEVWTRPDSCCKCLAPCSSTGSGLPFLCRTLILQVFLHPASTFLWKMKPFLCLRGKSCQLSWRASARSFNLLPLLWFDGAWVAGCIEKLMVLHIIKCLFLLLVLCQDVLK